MRNAPMGLIKFLLFLVLVPVIWAVTQAFHGEMQTVAEHYRSFLYWGGLTYVLLNLFFYDFNDFYQFGQRLTGEFLKFIPPLSRVLPFMIPIYTVLIVIIYYVISVFHHHGPSEPYFFFFIGFTFTMHIVMSAAELNTEEASIIKPDYYFSTALAYIACIFVLAFLMDWILPRFAFGQFFGALTGAMKDFYTLVLGRFV